MSSSDNRRAALGVLSPGFGGTCVPEWMRSALIDGLGSVTLFGSNTPDIATTRDVVGQLRDSSPGLIVAIDEEGGDVTRIYARQGSPFATPAALGFLDDVTITENSFAALGSTLASCDIDLDLAPVGDVSANQRNPIIGVRAFGASGDLVSRHLVAAVRGLERSGVAACVKHFPGHGGCEGDSHHVLPTVTVSQEEFLRDHLEPFKAVIDRDVPAIMVGHIVIPFFDSVAATISQSITTKLLKHDLGFEGVIVTDALDMGALGGPSAIPESAVAALRAGADLLCLSGLPNQSSFIEGCIRTISAAIDDGVLDLDDLMSRGDHVKSLRRGRGVVTSTPTPSELVGTIECRGSIQLIGQRVKIITVEAEPTIAAGEIKWGMKQALEQRSVQVVESNPDDVLIQARDCWRSTSALEELKTYLVAYPHALIVDMGWPVDEIVHSRLIRTRGASEVLAQAVAELVTP